MIFSRLNDYDYCHISYDDHSVLDCFYDLTEATQAAFKYNCLGSWVEEEDGKFRVYFEKKNNDIVKTPESSDSEAEAWKAAWHFWNSEDFDGNQQQYILNIVRCKDEINHRLETMMKDEEPSSIIHRLLLEVESLREDLEAENKIKDDSNDEDFDEDEAEFQELKNVFWN